MVGPARNDRSRRPKQTMTTAELMTGTGDVLDTRTLPALWCEGPALLRARRPCRALLIYEDDSRSIGSCCGGPDRGDPRRRAERPDIVTEPWRSLTGDRGENYFHF